MSYSSDLYPHIDPKKGYTSAKSVLESYLANRLTFENIDDLKQKCLNFVHGDQWDADVEATRKTYGLPSIVADRTLGVFKILDGHARKNRFDVKFAPVGSDDYESAELRNDIFSALRNSTNLHACQARAYGLAAIVDEAYLHVYPTMNILGEVEPQVQNLEPFEGYPDCNSKDPVNLRDAGFFDLPIFKGCEDILDELDGVAPPELLQRIREYRGGSSIDSEVVRNQHLDRSGDSLYERNGQLLCIKRYYRVIERVDVMVDAEGNERDIDPEEGELGEDPAVMEGMGLTKTTRRDEWIWTCILIPAIDDSVFFMNEPADFQPLEAITGKKLFPIVRIPFLMVGGKSIGAIRPVLKVQENRNLIISALVHHIQTAANGALGYEADAFGGDPEQERKFKEERNRAGHSIKFAPPGADGRTAKDKVFVLPKGEFAFADGGNFLEQVFNDLIIDLSGAMPVMGGKAQPGGPASLYKQQNDKAADQMLGSTELFKEAQFSLAEILHSFVQQFFTEPRILAIEGSNLSEDPQQVQINIETAEGILNDVGQGLYTVRKTEAPSSESSRRGRLSDNIEVIKALIDTQLPNFILDYESLVENMEIPQERKQTMLGDIAAWKSMQGLTQHAEFQTAQNQAAMMMPGGPGMDPAAAPAAPAAGVPGMPPAAAPAM